MSPREDQKLAKIRRIAVELYANDDIEFDEPLKPEDISEGAAGTWVHAWVWVPAEELNKDNLDA